MRILTSFPGKFGDLIWSLPSIRALSRRIGQPVDLLVAQPYGSICPLIEAQDYIGRCCADPGWLVENTAPMTPRTPNRQDVISPYDLTIHLGYRSWPARPLPFETLDCFNCANQFPRVIDLGTHPIPDAELALDEPWITVKRPAPPTEIAVGFTDEHFELKLGVTLLALQGRTPYLCLAPAGSRWEQERPRATYPLVVEGWEQTAGIIRNADLFLGCCSALHVLAVAVGTPAVIMEPNPHRHHPIFWPLGMAGAQVTLVTGNDNLPTFDARAVAAALESTLRLQQEIRT